MSPYQFGLLIVFASSLLGSPGPAVVSLAASGAAVGYRRSMPFLGGIMTGFLVNLLAVAFGLAAVFASSTTVHTWFKFISAAYIIYLAWKIGSSGPMEEGKSSPFGYPQGVLLNLLNPKAYIAAIAIITQFTTTGSGQTLQIAIIIIVSMLVAFVTQFGWVVAGDLLSHLFRHAVWARVLNIAMAVLMVASVILATFTFSF